MEQFTVINIVWEKIPFDMNIIKEKMGPSDYGLYQIYGHHPAYGEDTLLYIGKAQDQAFGVRLNERWEFIESCAFPTSFRLGRIVLSSKESESLGWDINRWKDMINIAEMILIRSHTPAFNKQLNSGIFNSELTEFNNEQFLIFNTEDYGRLLPEVSNLRWSYRYWNFEKPISKLD
jgi:hypothetical protein